MIRIGLVSLGPLACSPRRGACLLLAAALCVGGLGCDQRSAPRQHGPQKTTASQQAENFDRAFDLLDGSFEFGSDEGYLRSSFFVNEWLSDQKLSDWAPDPALASLPPEIRELPDLRGLGRLEVDTDDMRHLEGVLLARQLSDWVVQTKTPQLTDSWLQENEAFSDEQRVQLGRAIELFDWTVRNIHLQLVRRKPNAAVGQLAEPWPGDWMLPRDVLVYGRGDSWQRGRVFLQLCRQQGLEAMMLACAAPGGESDPTPWAAAVAVGERLYLFDPALGLPIPGPGGKGVATLTQAAEDPSVLAYLNVGAQLPYPVGPDQLGRLQLLVDAAPESLSARMALIQERLTGERRLALAESITAAAQRWEKHPHIQRVAPWRLSLQANALRRDARRAMLREPRRAFEMASALALIPLESDQGEPPLLQARKLHLRGRFELDENDKPGAKGKYMEIRVPQSKLDALDSDTSVQRELGASRAGGEREELWRQRLETIKIYYTQALWHTSYWLAMIQFDQGNYESALGWLQLRNLEALPASPWLDDVRYNLARCYELTNRVDEARSIYLTDESPQQHGNLIRAKLLAR